MVVSKGTAVIAILNDWIAGITGQVTVTNTGPAPTEGWEVEIDTPGQITAAWNGSITSQSPGKYFVINAAWNGHLAPDASVTFGFNLTRAPGNSAIQVGLTSIGGTPVVTSTPSPVPVPALQVANVFVNESGTEPHLAVFAVHLSAASSTPVTVSYATVNGSALSGRDYDAATGTLTFAAGQTDATVSVGTHAGAPGSDLKFALALSNPSGATLPAVAATAEIVTPAALPTPTPTPPPTFIPAASLVLGVSEDAFQGDAQFTVSVDGKQVAGTYTAPGLHGAGKSQTIGVPGTFGAGQHSVAVTFLNDAYAGPGQDRNLYLDTVSFNGTLQMVGAGLYTSGASATVTVGQAATPTPTPAPAPIPVPTPAAGSFKYLGVNLSGAEFGIPNPTNGGVNIGTYGTEYTYPTYAELDYYASKHLNTIRLPFSWERLEPVQNGPLDPTQLGYLDSIVRYAATRGETVVLDPHNYGYGYGNLIGSAGTPDASFAGFWSKLGAHYAGQPNVIFGLMNEPHVQTPAQWAQPVNDAIAAIRATGATQEILVPGTAYTGGSSWVSSGNASIFAANVVDPLHNMAYEIHQYSDGDGSGSSTSVVSPTVGADRLQAVTAWAEGTGNKLFLGEFGAGQDAASIANLQNMLGYMQQHTDVWQGGTEWGGGPWWGSYFFGTDPQNGTTTPQVATLATFAPKVGT